MIAGVNHITLAVTDLPRSIWFYTDILGGTLRADWSHGAYLELGELWLCLTLSDTPIQSRQDYTHIALSCKDADFPTLSRQIRDHAELWQDNKSEGASLYFRDPDGHQLELHQGNLASRLAHYRTQVDGQVRVYD
ncbi:VOC family protein [Aliiroseovarius sp. S1123]|uniref:VOC family protein n=1 Tax=unclassified Aliiroseovarius TaxID=2623558 RepID=UPI001FF3C38F|nr:VOC family protein [Aliiroseovarius sp. S1123]MCK0169708.1 VOC family protein [Aliiroseovarius sp. S1123]